MNQNKEAKSLTFWRGSEASQVASGAYKPPEDLIPQEVRLQTSSMTITDNLISPKTLRPELLNLKALWGFPKIGDPNIVP